MRLLIISAVLFAACLPLFAADKPKELTDEEDKFQWVIFDVLSDHPEIFETANNAELAVEKLTKEYYKDTSNRQNNAFYALLGLVAVSIIYLVFVDRRKYKEAVELAEKAAERTERICDRAEILEQRGQAILENIDRDANAKLKEIEDEKQAGLATLDRDVKIKLEEIEQKLKELQDVGTEITNEAKKERDINPLWNEAYNIAARAKSELDGDERRLLFTEAAAIYEKATQIKDDFYEGYNNWGNTLGNVADLDETSVTEKRQLFTKAAAKYKKATQINDDFYEAYLNWGNILIQLYYLELDPIKKQDILKEIEPLYQKAEDSEPGCAAYRMACLFALQADPDQCRIWLETAERYGTLGSRKRAMRKPELESVRDEDWFKGLEWEGPK